MHGDTQEVISQGMIKIETEENLLVVDGAKTIVLWPWETTPLTYRKLTGDDKEHSFVALVPPELQGLFEALLSSSPHFADDGVVDRYTLETGQKVYIGT